MLGNDDWFWNTRVASWRASPSNSIYSNGCDRITLEQNPRLDVTCSCNCSYRCILDTLKLNRPRPEIKTLLSIETMPIPSIESKFSILKTWKQTANSLTVLLVGLGIFYLLFPAVPDKYQVLPIEATTTINGQTIELEIADTLPEVVKGLKYRPKLETNRGMLFEFEQSQTLKFWLKDVIIPLDLIFLDGSRVVKIVESAEPCAEKLCLLYEARGDRVIELNDGMVGKLKLSVGDEIEIKKKLE